MTEIGSAHLKFTTDDSKIDRAFLKIKKGFGGMDRVTKGFSKVMNSVAGQMTLAFGGVFAAQKVKQFFTNATKNALAFERGMIRVNTVTQLSAEKLKVLEDGLRKLSKEIAAPLTDLQNGLFDVASAGIEAGNQLDFLTASAAFAAVGAFDVGTAVKGLTAILKGYGLGLADTERIMNLFLQTNVKGQTTLRELSTSVQDVTAVARNAGISLEEFFAVFATGTGVTGNAARVATQFKGAINALAAPTKETSQRFKDMGIKIGRSAIEAKGFVGLAKEIFDAVGGDAEQLRRLIPEIEATTLITALATTQFDKFNENLQENQGELNLTAKQYQEFAESASGNLIIAQNAWASFTQNTGNMLLKIFLFLDTFVGKIIYLRKQIEVLGNMKGSTTLAEGYNEMAEELLKEGIKEKDNQKIKEAGELFEKAGHNARVASGEMEIWNENAKELGEGSVKRLKEALDNLSGSQQVFASDTGGSNEKIDEQIESVAGAKKAIDGISDSYDDWQEGMEKTGDKLEILAKKNSDLMEDIRGQIKDTAKEMKNLESSFVEESSGERGDFWKEMADDIVKYTKERKELEGKTDKSDSDLARLKELKALEQESRKYLAGQTVSSSAGNKIFQDLIAQAETRAGRSAAQVKIDEYNAEQSARDRNFEDEKAVLKERQLLLQQIDDGEKINLEDIENEKTLRLVEDLLAKKAQIDEDIKLTKDQQIQLTKAWQEGAVAIEGVNDELIGKLDSKYQALAARIKSYLASATGSGGGGEVGFASGGLTGAGSDGEVAGVVHKNEYVIPANILSALMPTGLIGTIEKMRRGFAGGGFTGGETQNVANKTINVNQQNTIREGIDLSAFNERLLFELNRY